MFCKDLRRLTCPDKRTRIDSVDLGVPALEGGRLKVQLPDPLSRQRARAIIPIRSGVLGDSVAYQVQIHGPPIVWQTRIRVSQTPRKLPKYWQNACLPLHFLSTGSLQSFGSSGANIIMALSHSRSRKITVIGAGNVGATVAECVARKDMVEEVVLVDIVEGMPQGKALDIQQSAPIHLFDTHVTGSNSYEATAGSEIGIITAGLPRKPGMSRDDLLSKNAQIVRSVTEQFVAGSPEAVLIVVSNPLDVMTYVAYSASSSPTGRVIGMAGVLDTARFRAFIAIELGVSVRDVQALLMGGHGDSMVPLPRYTTVSGIPLPELMSAERINQLVDRTKFGGGEIVKLMGTSAWYAPGAAAAEMAEAIVKDSGRLVPSAAWLNGEYGLNDIFIGVPVRLGRGGVREVIEVELEEDERALLHASAEGVREMVQALDRLQAV